MTYSHIWLSQLLISSMHLVIMSGLLYCGPKFVRLKSQAPGLLSSARIYDFVKVSHVRNQIWGVPNKRD